MFEPKLDSLKMFSAAADTGAQILSGAEKARGTGMAFNSSQIENILVVAMGGSAMAGDLAGAVAKEDLKLPFIISRSYELPAFVGPKTLVAAISFSGNTAETLSAVDSAVLAGAQVLGITSGGDLAKMSNEHSFPLVQVTDSISMPRAALAELSSAFLQVLGDAGLYPKAEAELALAEQAVQKRAMALAKTNSAAQKMAENIHGTFPLVVGSVGIGATAARRWKTQINENSKTPAFFSEIPEAFHNELVGWGLHGDISRQVISIIQLRSDYEPHQLSASLPHYALMQEEVVADCFEVKAGGKTALSQIWDLILMGDFVSLFLADLAGVDPGPIPAIEELKRLTSEN